jgi:DNA-binding NtrC family response regulator
MARPWLGNVRELRNFVERALALGAREALALSAAAGSADAADAQIRFPPALLALPYKEMRERVLLAAERDYIEALLARHDRDVSAAAETAGLNRTYLYRLVAKHRL